MSGRVVHGGLRIRAPDSCSHGTDGRVGQRQHDKNGAANQLLRTSFQINKNKRQQNERSQRDSTCTPPITRFCRHMHISQLLSLSDNRPQFWSGPYRALSAHQRGANTAVLCVVHITSLICVPTTWFQGFGFTKKPQDSRRE